MARNTKIRLPNSKIYRYMDMVKPNSAEKAIKIPLAVPTDIFSMRETIVMDSTMVAISTIRWI